MGGKTSTSTSGISIPPAVLAQYESVTSQANQTATTPFQTYGGQFVAPVNAQQQTGIENTNTAADSYQPYYNAAAGTLGETQGNTTGMNNAATGLAAAGAGAVNATPLTGEQINSYLSPYLGDVLGSTEAIQNQENQQAQAGQLGDAITSGAFGSDRTGITAANLQQQLDLANNSTIANIANTGYTNAQSVAEQQQGVNLAAGQANRAALETAGTNIAGIGQTAYGEGANTASELAALGTGAQTAGLTGAAAQLGAGTVEQQTQQAQDTAEYNQFLQQQSYPFQVGSWLAGISEGIGTNEGSTTTTTQPGGFFSDKRLKRDIQKIGKTYDGQSIYSYKMGDDPRTRIGLIAQEVEKKHPEAVGLAAGFKMVDYGKATEPAANRGHFRMGGVVPFRRARAYGGGTDINGVLQAQQQMYAGVAGGSNQRQMPSQSNGGSHLAVANAPPVAAHNGASDVTQSMQIANQGQKLYKSFNTPSAPTATTPANSGLSPAGVQPSGATTFADPSAVASPSGVAPETSGWAPAADSAATTAAPAATDAAATTAAPAAADAAAGAAGGVAAGAGADAATAAAAEVAADYVGADALAAVAFAKRGGRIKRDVGGGMPYSDPAGGPYGTAGGIYEIPNQGQDDNSLKAAPGAGKQPTGLQTLMYMGDPNNTSSLMGSMFSNTALKRGGAAGRSGYADGGSPDDAPEPSADDTPDAGLANAAAAPAPASGGVAGSPDPDSDSFLKKAGKFFTDNRAALVPILSGISAMGTAKTVHPGVALAAGLGAGAQSYMNTQEGLADIRDVQAKARGQELSNQLSQVTNQAAMDALSGKGPYAAQLKTAQASQAASPDGQAEPVIDPSQTAAQIDQSTRAKYATPTITADEQNYLNRMSALSAATKNAAWKESAQTAIQSRFAHDQFANQQAAQHEAATYKAIMADPTQSQEIRQAATAHYNSVMQFTGSQLQDVGGSLRESTTGAPAAGARTQVLTPAQRMQGIIAQASPVSSGANQTEPLSQFAAENNVPLPDLGPNSTGAPTRVAPTRTPGGNGVPPSANTASDPFQNAPMKPPYIDNPRAVLTDEQKDMSKTYADKETALRQEAGNLTATQQEQINVRRILGELQNTRTGPGMDAVSKFQTAIGNMTGNDWHDFFQSDPAAFQMLTKGTGNEAFFKTMKDMRDSGGEVRLGQKSEEIIMNELSASPLMAKKAITSMMNWRLQDLNAMQRRQQAIPAYLNNGHDAMQFDSIYPTRHPLSQQLTVEPNSVNPTPTVAGVPTSTNSPPPIAPVRVNSRAEADALPKGTRFIDPRGRTWIR